MRADYLQVQPVPDLFLATGLLLVFAMIVKSDETGDLGRPPPSGEKSLNLRTSVVVLKTLVGQPLLVHFA
jgi:hypothetical protein